MDSTNPLHVNAIDRELEINGLEYITTARRNKRGGGVAVVVNKAKGYSVKKLHVNNAAGKGALETAR